MADDAELEEEEEEAADEEAAEEAEEQEEEEEEEEETGGPARKSMRLCRLISLKVLSITSCKSIENITCLCRTGNKCD